MLDLKASHVLSYVVEAHIHTLTHWLNHSVKLQGGKGVCELEDTCCAQLTMIEL